MLYLLMCLSLGFLVDAISINPNIATPELNCDSDSVFNRARECLM
jgi:hypothetical protein